MQLLIDNGLKKLHESWKDKTDCGKLWSDTISQQVNIKLSARLNNISSVQKSTSVAKEKILDSEDKWKRMNNIIIYNVTESSGSSTADRNAEEKTHAF